MRLTVLAIVGAVLLSSCPLVSAEKGSISIPSKHYDRTYK